MHFMNQSFEQIAAAALRLPPEDREALVERLLASLGPKPGHDEGWAEELERRMAAVEDGTAELIPMEEVFARLKSTR